MLNKRSTIKHIKRNTKAKIRLIITLVLFYTTFYNSVFSQVPNTIQRTDSLLNSLIKNKSYEKAINISHDLSIKKYKHKQLFQAIKYSLIEKKAYEESNIINKPFINCLYNLGFFYYKNASYNNAINFYSKVISLNIDSIQTAKAYCEIGRTYNKTGDFFKSINYYKKGIDLLKKLNKKKILLKKYLNYSIVHLNVGSKKSFIERFKILKKASLLITKQTPYKVKHTLNNQYANYYNKKEGFDYYEAKKYYLKNIELNKKHKDTLLLAETYNNLSDLYIKQQNDSARFFINQGLLLVKKGISKARLHDNYSQFYLIKNNLNKALEHIDLSIKENLKTTPNYQNEINRTSLFKNPFKYHLLHCFNKKTEILIKLFQNSKEPSFLELALNSVKNATKLIGILQQSSTESKTKLHWRTHAFETFSNGSYIAKLLHNDSMLFYFMEKSKALSLTESIVYNTQLSFLPTHVKERENNLMKTIYAHEDALDNLKNNSKKKTIQNALFSAKLEYDKYIDSIKPLFNDYFKNKVNIQLTSLKEAQLNIPNHKSAIISYTWNEIYNKILGIVILKNKTYSFKIDSALTTGHKIEKYKKLISSPFIKKRDLKSFQKTSFNLYQTLFPSEKIRQLVLNKNLLIVTDGKLHDMPFEALITKENTNNYLINTNNTSYTYSMSFLKYNNIKRRKHTSSFIGFAPVNFNNSGNSLQNSEKEIRTIKEIIGGKAFNKKNATKETFYSETSQSKIIHLATHANASNKPWIGFYNDTLFLHELYTHKINANLVTLSACETTLGETIVGEGVFSLARGFFFSGAKSVTSSLWKVNDKASQQIMEEFYRNLKKGQHKNTALTNAKRTYITNNSLSDSSPYYWASFILIGDSNSIEFSNKNYILIYILLALSCFLLFFLKKRG
ncbi:CHAT domain-containing tetratricopeptide repeat protein [Tenacibaculum sp. 190524A02b]|uniref:CHAT domain-containing protein n=1 Tax=Tenacibaculum vairaonense TaxID=3137860 RepID=UPI0032B2BEFE